MTPEEIKKYNSKYYIENSDKVKKLTSRYYFKNADEINTARRKRYNENKDKYRELTRQWYRKNKEKAKISSIEWRKNNPDKYKEIQAGYVMNNPEKIKSSLAKWYLANPEKVKVRKHKRRAREKNAEGSFTAEEILSMLKRQHKKCVVCRVDISKSYHIDHIMPLILGGSNKISNIQLLCPHCNYVKNSQHPITFMQSRGYLL